MAAVSCPNTNPVVNENNCMGAGSQGWRLGNFSEDIAGYTTQTSFAKGASVPLKIARNAPILPQTRVDITVYRTGYYGGEGARLIPGAGATNVPVNNNFTCNTPNATTGELSCANWGVTYTIPGSALPASGVYVAKLRTTDTNVENRVVFVVRDDNRVPESRALLVLPTATYLAYNTWGGKSLYRDKNGGAATVSGTDRAVKVSFDRPLDQNDMDRDRYFGPDFFTVQWLERQGYDVSYTDDVQAHLNPARAARAQGARDPGPLRVLVPRAVPQLQGGARRRRQHRLLQRQHRVLEGPLRERHAHDGLLQDRPGRRVGRQRSRHAQRPGPDGAGRHGRRRARPRRAGGHRRRSPAELHHHLPRQRRSPRRPQRAARRAASGPTCRRTSSSASCTSATTTAPTTR